MLRVQRCLDPALVETLKTIIIIMDIFKCYFFREHIALSYRNGVNIELGKTNRLKTLCMMQNHT